MEPGPGPDPDPGLDPDMEPGRDPAAGPGHDPGTGPVPGADPVTDPANDPDVEPLHRGGFRCRLCQITTANLPSLLSHLSGKRHRRLRCLRAERRAQAQRSLFVSGFPRGTAPERLRRHFRAFGPVATVVMDKEKGAFAIVELRDPAGRQRALQEPRHLLGGRRLRVRPREHRDWPRDPPRDPPGTPQAPPGLLQELGRAQDVGAQLQLLVAALELSAAERRLRELLVSLVREVFTEFFPGCSVVPYGSSVNGFDVHGCDLDLHLELGDPQGQETPNGDPQIPQTPNGDPQMPATPNGDPQIPETPNGDSQMPATPNGDPQSPATPNRNPQSLRTPNRNPQIPETPNRDPQIPEAPNRDPQIPATPNRDPQSLRTPNRDPQIPATPNRDPQSLRTPNRDPQSPATPNRDPQIPATPNRDPQIPATPNRDPQIPATPNRDPQMPETPNRDPQSPGALLGDGVPPPQGSLLGSLSGDGDPSLEGSLLGSEGSLSGDKGSLLGSPVGDRDLSLEGSLLGSGGSLSGSPLGTPDPFWGSEPASPAGSPRGSEGGSLSGDESPGSEGSPLGSGGSLLGCGGSLLGRGAPPEQLLALVGAVLRRCVPGVRGVRAVPGARRPVVKFSHKQSGLAGDVCLDNRLALFNTRFLRLCADADPRVRPLGYALRLWAGRQRLAGNRAGGGPLLTNYALTLLLVLFLQSRSPPVLPSVRRLRLLAGPQDRAQVGGWDCSFPRDAAALEPSGNGQSAASLLAEFFSYFGSLDLGGLLLSPLEGRALPRPPPESLGGLRPGPLTLQDPFELSHNVAANVTARTVSRFARCCRDAARLCRGPEFLQKSRRGRPWGVMRLLQPGPAGNPGGSPGKFLIPVPLRPPAGCGGVPQLQVSAALGFVLREVLGCGCEPEVGSGDAGTEGEPPPGAECHLEGGTGGSRGESGDTGDEEEPPPGGECHLEGGTGGSRGEFGDPGDEDEPPPGGECHLEGGTGGSRGEFGDTGDEEEPPPGAECHLEGGTGGSRGEFGDVGTAGPGSKRRLPEGVPDGAGVPPAKRPRGPSRWSCCVWYRVWRGRRRLRRRLRPRGGSGGAPGTEGNRGDQGLEGPEGAPDAGGVQDLGGSPLALERAVTEAIVRGETGTPPGPPPEPLLRFQLSARPGGSRRDPQMLLQLQPDPPSPLFQEFFHFLRSFLPEMVRQRLGWGRAGGAEPPGGGEFVNLEVLQ